MGTVSCRVHCEQTLRNKRFRIPAHQACHESEGSCHRKSAKKHLGMRIAGKKANFSSMGATVPLKPHEASIECHLVTRMLG